jgi:hypothetical protein
MNEYVCQGLPILVPEDKLNTGLIRRLARAQLRIDNMGGGHGPGV